MPTMYSSKPALPVRDDIYYDVNLDKMFVYTSTGWTEISVSPPVVDDFEVMFNQLKEICDRMCPEALHEFMMLQMKTK